jgi:hypothetical protein
MERCNVMASKRDRIGVAARDEATISPSVAADPGPLNLVRPLEQKLEARPTYSRIPRSHYMILADDGWSAISARI